MRERDIIKICYLFYDEITFVTQKAQEDPRLRGIVAWAPLEKGKAVLSELEELKENAMRIYRID